MKPNRSRPSFLRNIYKWSLFLGIDPLTFWRNVKGLPWFFNDYRRWKQLSKGKTDFAQGNWFLTLQDRRANAGISSGHYFHQDLWVARRIYETSPIRLLDVGSRIDGYIAHVASFREIEVLDIRDNPQPIINVRFQVADLMQPPPEKFMEAFDTISSLHALEHFGLGRYGDTLNYDGYKTALHHIHQMLKTDGTFFFSVPIGPQRVEFNAQRVFSVAFLLELLSIDYEILHFCYVDDLGDFHENVALTQANIEVNFGCFFGCGIFELRKL